jgi:hypothetical protein
LASLCFCSICALPDQLGNPRCSGKYKRILVTVLDQPDPTGSPDLWRTFWRGSIIPVKFFNGEPIEGATYIAHLMCASSEYMTFLDQLALLGEGSLWVLYDSQEVYLVELPSTITNKPAWALEGESGGFMALGISQLDELVIKASSADIYYSADSADSWSNVLSVSPGNESMGDIRFDQNNASIGFAALKPDSTMTSGRKSLIQNDFVSKLPLLPQQNYTPSNVHSNYIEYNANIFGITVYSTFDGGATWTPETVGYIGAHVPTRLVGSPQTTQFKESVTGGDCNWNALLDVCTWETLGDVPTVGSYPCMAGAVTSINLSGTTRHISNTRDTAGDVKQYAICDAAGAQSSANLTFFPPVPGSNIVAPKHDGLGYYVSQPTTYRGFRYTGLFGGADEYATPFLYHPSPSLTTLRTTILMNQDGDEWVVNPSDLTNGGSEQLSTDLQVDRLSTTTLYGISTSPSVYRLGWTGQTITDISPVLAGDVFTVNEMLVTESNTLLLPMYYFDGVDSVFGVWRSTDQGDTWAFTNMNSESEEIDSETCRIVQSAQDDTIFMALYGGVFAYSDDDGLTWNFTGILGEEESTVIDVAAG